MNNNVKILLSVISVSNAFASLWLASYNPELLFLLVALAVAAVLAFELLFPLLEWAQVRLDAFTKRVRKERRAPINTPHE